MRIALGYRVPEAAAEQTVQRTLAWAGPRLPHASARLVPRWTSGPTWTPPGTILLVRHRSHDGRRCLVTNDRIPPPGFAIEFDLGLVHAFSQPGTMRLLATPDGFQRTPFEGELEEGLRALGYVEQAPLPLLEGLELRRDPVGGDVTLVAGPSDPLFETAAPVGHVGFVESFPINPRKPLDVRIERGLATLVRDVDEQAWRHRYAAVEPDGEAAGVALGGVWSESRRGTTPLWRDAQGRVGSELLSGAGRRTPAPDETLKWVGAPLTWSGRRPRAWALRATAGRARRLTQAVPRSLGELRGARGELTVLGHVRVEPTPGWSPLFSARHPVLGDQYLTRSELEAHDMGYVVEGIVGHVADRRADTAREALPNEVKWASRFGHRRRYVEGPAG